MISSEVQRTLVKSPPELWAELSDPALLARHLGELGEIRITRVEPEQTVEWEAENANGTVQIKPSGWGTRVPLTVTHELPEDGAEEPAETEAGAAATSPAQPGPGWWVDVDPRGRARRGDRTPRAGAGGAGGMGGDGSARAVNGRCVARTRPGIVPAGRV